ncbi:MAG: M23 family metallopeptidase [Oscillospiraceae bacterium]|nr:M23 family metallopeptidase [Oscillospiraceae bacterium]
MSSNSSGKRLEGFFAGKGFYIVLFLCAAVIGVSAWVMAAGNETMNSGDIGIGEPRVETIVIPAQQEIEEELPVEAPQVLDEGLVETQSPVEDEGVQVWREGDVMEVAAPVYAWPVSGELERSHSMETLGYDITLSDWRTHDGVDILAEMGSEVKAAHCGTVESIDNDDLYGMTVIVSHGDGTKTVYSNLADEVSVAVGDWVEPGMLIGTIGDTALCEIGQQSHLHFAISVDGQSVDPLSYLPA